jgi:hypothetical protein
MRRCFGTAALLFYRQFQIAPKLALKSGLKSAKTRASS